ncbi:MBL fold metallo-hydrolase [Methanothrix sp.]|uniref:MBL fold metallo-hydrolase n=1 Tax=Methanothrix sp. TaxID=90426 RepID=UPI0034E2E989
MKVTVLVDNNTYVDRYFRGEPGFSAFVEHDDRKILFDLGYSDLFVHNAARMGVDLLDLDYIVLSHGHLDHSGGLYHLIRYYMEERISKKNVKTPTLLAHPYALQPRPKPPLPDIGPLISADQVGRHLQLLLTREPYRVGRDLLFLGEIPRPQESDDQGRRIVLQDGTLESDRLLDDTALAFRGKDGLVIITGCSHAGIGNIVRRAQRLTGEGRVDTIIGGLHLEGPSKALSEAMDLFRQLPVHRLYACHCTSLQAKIELSKVVPLKEVGVGLTLGLD